MGKINIAINVFFLKVYLFPIREYQMKNNFVCVCVRAQVIKEKY